MYKGGETKALEVPVRRRRVDGNAREKPMVVLVKEKLADTESLVIRTCSIQKLDDSTRTLLRSFICQ